MKENWEEKYVICETVRSAGQGYQIMHILINNNYRFFFFIFFIFYNHTSIVYRLISHINYGMGGLKKPFQAFLLSNPPYSNFKTIISEHVLGYGLGSKTYIKHRIIIQLCTKIK